jgi:hypothetical protein
MNCLVCDKNTYYEDNRLNEDDKLCLECFENKYQIEIDEPLCMTCGIQTELVDDMYCFDCLKRQRFTSIFSESKCYELGSYFGKHIFERYLGYYVSENDFIAFMRLRGYKFNENKRTFKVKINKKKALEILGEKI